MAVVGARSRTPSPERVYYKGVPAESLVYWTEAALPEAPVYSYAVVTPQMPCDQAADEWYLSCWGSWESWDSWQSWETWNVAKKRDAAEKWEVPEEAAEADKDGFYTPCTMSEIGDPNDMCNPFDESMLSTTGGDSMTTPRSSPEPSLLGVDTADSIIPPPPAPVAGRTRRRRRRRRHGGSRSGAAQVEADTDSDDDDEQKDKQKDVRPVAASVEKVAKVGVRGGVVALPEHERMLNNFKTSPCPLDASQDPHHDHRRCPFYHGERDRRRKVSVKGGQAHYSAEPCPEQFEDDKKGRCSKGDDCTKCHSTIELHYHPDNFRTRLCHTAERCPRGRYCAFAHSNQELLVPHFQDIGEKHVTEDDVIHNFKTTWCPLAGQHDWENCLYAHTFRDWRRSPLIGYSSRPCPHWAQNVDLTTRTTEMSSYDERCPRGLACPLAHGAKEQLYHPQWYKTKPCKANCKRGMLCAFKHGTDDARQPLPEDKKHQQEPPPIPDVLELLKKYQPSYWKTPNFHLLEEQPRRRRGRGRVQGKWSAHDVDANLGGVDAQQGGGRC